VTVEVDLLARPVEEVARVIDPRTGTTAAASSNRMERS
jgi:hypothetical protein